MKIASLICYFRIFIPTRSITTIHSSLCTVTTLEKGASLKSNFCFPRSSDVLDIAISLHDNGFRLSPILPIDVVYTWVNGSDTELMLQLREAKQDLIKKGLIAEMNISGEGN